LDFPDALAAENNRRHGARRQERTCASLVLASVTVLCCFAEYLHGLLSGDGH